MAKYLIGAPYGPRDKYVGVADMSIVPSFPPGVEELAVIEADTPVAAVHQFHDSIPNKAFPPQEYYTTWPTINGLTVVRYRDQIIRDVEEA